MVDQITPGLHRTRTYHSSLAPSLFPFPGEAPIRPTRRALPLGPNCSRLTEKMQGFYDPVNEKMFEPSHTGFSYSFTADGFYEEAYYRAISNRVSFTAWKFPQTLS